MIKKFSRKLKKIDNKLHKKNFQKFIYILIISIISIILSGILLPYPYNITFVMAILCVFGGFSYAYKHKLNIEDNFHKNIEKPVERLYKKIITPKNKNLKLKIGGKTSLKDKIKKYKNLLKGEKEEEKYIEVK